jgi:hypothetical protein
MMYMALKRKQIYLDVASDRALKRLAGKTRLSEAEHIRRAVSAYVRQGGAEPARRPGRDPLLEIIGIGDNSEAPADASSNHDTYLYRGSR